MTRLGISCSELKKVLSIQQQFLSRGVDLQAITATTSFIQSWEQELTVVAEKEQRFQIKTQEQERLLHHSNSNVGDYYEIVKF